MPVYDAANGLVRLENDSLGKIMPEADETREVLAGLVERVNFHNEQNGYCVCA
jgi:hypothetical protein